MLLSQEFVWVLFFLTLVWLAVVSFFLFRTVSHYRHLTSGVVKGDLVSILEEILKGTKVTEKRIEEIIRKTEGLEKEGVSHLQKIGLVRFNPFSDTGGSQSFTLAVLNGKEDGIIISSLHSRDQTRIYTKPIRGAKPIGFELSKEEKEAVEKAQKQ